MRKAILSLVAFGALLVLFALAANRIDLPDALIWLGPLSISALVTFFMVPVLRTGAVTAGLVDLPDARKHHSGAIPLVGGIAVFLGLAAAILYYQRILGSSEVRGLMIALFLLLVIGVADDLLEIRATVKLLAQLAAAAIVIAAGIRVTFLPPVWWGDVLEVFITAVWLIGLTNAINFLDGVDGLATTLTVVTAVAFGVVAVQTSQGFFLLLCAALAGGCLGFLPYNFRRRPASAFLGDAGATVLGFALASIAVFGEWSGPRSVTLDIVVPLLILGVPIFDTTFITLTRIADGRIRTFRGWLEYTGRDHIHHRLMNIGLSRFDTVGAICVISTVLALSAITLHNATGPLAAVSLLQGIVILTAVGRFMLFVETRPEQDRS